MAFIVAHGESPSADEILAHCAERLASYKRPARIVFLDQIPRTASGKAQKHILRQTPCQQLNTIEPATAPNEMPQGAKHD